jgi:hypothetical protein
MVLFLHHLFFIRCNQSSHGTKPIVVAAIPLIVVALPGLLTAIYPGLYQPEMMEFFI